MIFILFLKSYSQQAFVICVQKCKPLFVPADPDELPGVDVHPYFSLMVLRRAITELQERVNDVCDRELARISDLSEFSISIKQTKDFFH